MINKLEVLQNLTTDFLDDEFNEKNLDDEILNHLKSFKKSDILKYIKILLQSASERNHDFKNSDIWDGFAFWIDDETEKQVIIDYAKIEEYKNNNLNLIDVIKDCFKFKNIIIYTYNPCYYDTTFNKNNLEKIILELEKNQNKIIQIYEENKSLFLQVADDFDNLNID